MIDHLGNGRVWVKYNELTEQPEVIQQADYYPFGLQHDGKQTVQSGVTNNYTFNGSVTGDVESMKEANLGMEFVEDLGLNIHHAYYRTYDPAIGRMWQIDPLAEDLFSATPYNAFLNNPILFNDPNADFPPKTRGEWKFAFNNLFTGNNRTVSKTAGRASKIAGSAGTNLSHGPGSEKNALRHAVGQALLTHSENSQLAEKAADAHESGHKDILTENEDKVTQLENEGTTSFDNEDKAGSFVDQLNNEAGREIGENSSSESEVIFNTADAFASGKLYGFTEQKDDDGNVTYTVSPTSVESEDFYPMLVNMLQAAGIIQSSNE